MLWIAIALPVSVESYDRPNIKFAVMYHGLTSTSASEWLTTG